MRNYLQVYFISPSFGLTENVDHFVVVNRWPSNGEDGRPILSGLCCEVKVSVRLSEL